VVGTPDGVGVAPGGVCDACAIGEGLGLGPGLARVVVTSATMITEVAATPTTPIFAFRFNAVALWLGRGIHPT